MYTKESQTTCRSFLYAIAYQSKDKISSNHFIQPFNLKDLVSIVVKIHKHVNFLLSFAL